MEHSMQIKDSTLRETSYKNGIHYLEVGDYVPVLYPTENNNVTDIRVTKIFIATNQFVEGDRYSLFNRVFTLVNKDITIHKGDYIKATFDFEDLSLKLVNVSRIYFTPNTTISDIDYTREKRIERTITDIMEIKVVSLENNDISINTTVYAFIPEGTLTLYLHCDELSTEPINVVNYSANINKKYDIQNTFNITDIKANQHLTIKLKAKFTPNDPDSEEECVMIDRSSGIFITSKKIELDYPCWEDTFYYEEYSDHIKLLYLKSYPDDIVIPNEINGKPVTELNQILFYYIPGESFQYGDNITTIEEGAFYGASIKGLGLPTHGKWFEIKPYAYSYGSGIGRAIFDNNTKTELIPYKAFYKNNLSELIITDNVKYLDTYSFGECALVKCVLGPCVEEVREYALINTITMDLELNEGLKIFYHNGTNYGNIVVPSTVEHVELSTLYGNFDYSNMTTPVTELKFHTWYNYNYDEMYGDLPKHQVIPESYLGWYDKVVIDPAIQFVSFVNCYCDEFEIQYREPDNPLTIDYFGVKPYSQIPRYDFTKQDSTESFILNNLSTLHGLDFRGVKFTDRTSFETLSRFKYDTANNTSNMYPIKRYIFDKYLEYIPKYLGCKCDTTSSQSGLVYKCGTYFSGNVMSIPATKIVRSHTFDHYSRYVGYSSDTSRDSLDIEFLQCEKIETNAFYKQDLWSKGYGYGDSWTSIVIGYGCKSIASYAFYRYSELQSFTVPATVTDIGDNAFYCGTENYSTTINLYLPDTLKNKNFKNSGLAYVTYSIQYYDATYTDRFGFSDSADYSTITSFTFNNYLKQYCVPETHNGKPVKVLNAVFNGKDTQKIIEVIILAKITSIASKTFYNVKNIQRIQIPETVETINSEAFSQCICLNRLEFLGNKITKIYNNAFYNVGHTREVRCWYWNNNVIHNGVDYMIKVNNNKFGTTEYFRDEMSIHNLQFTDDITIIGQYAFYYSIVAVGNIKLPENDTYKTVEQYTFCGAPYITKLTVPSTITTVKNNAFEYMYGCREITIADNTVLNSTFTGCEMLERVNRTFNSFIASQFKNCYSLKHITFGDSLASIPDDCFNGCRSLEEIELLSPVTLGKRAFANCINLRRINVDMIISIDTDCFENTNLDQDIVNEIIAKFSPYDKMFAGNKNITTITLPDGYTLKAHQFEGCSNLKSINGFTDVSSIPDYCFSGTNLTSDIVNKLIKNATTIGNNAFSNNDTIEYVTLKNNITNIGEYAFANCTNLSTVNWLTNANIIPKYCFYNCALSGEDGFRNTNIIKVGSYAFAKNKFTTLYMPVAEYEDNAFEECGDLEYIYFEDTSDATELWFGGAMFFKCYELKNVYIANTIRTLHISNMVFEYCHSLEFGPHDLYNKFDTVILEKIFWWTDISGTSRYATFGSNIFSNVQNPKNPEPIVYEDNITITCEFKYNENVSYSESKDTGTYSAKWYELSICPKLFLGNYIYKRMTFNKNIPMYCFTSYTSSGCIWTNYASSDVTKQYVKDTIDRNATYALYQNIDFITLGPNFKRIEKYAFYSKSTVNTNVAITFTNNTTGPWTISEYGFFGGTSYDTFTNNPSRLYVIDLKNCTSVGEYAFRYNMYLNTIKNMDDLRAINKYAFDNCTALANVNISNISIFNTNCFYNSGIKLSDTHVFSQDIDCISENAFAGSRMTNFICDENINIYYIDGSAFYGTTIDKVVFPKTKIKFFAACCTDLRCIEGGIESVNYNNVSSNAFYGMDFTSSPTFTLDCKNIYGGGTFRNTTNLDEIIFSENIEDFSAKLSDEETAYATEKGFTYNSSMTSSSYVNSLVQSSSAKTVTFAGSRETIKISRAFSYYYGMLGKGAVETVNLPLGLTAIPSFMFSEANALATINNFEDSEVLTQIGSYAFYNCTSLQRLTLPNSVTTLMNNCFDGCTNLQELSMPTATLTSIGTYAFQNCKSLTVLDFSDNENITSLGSYTFSGCTGLTEIRLPRSCKSTASYCFSGCSGLTKLYLSKSCSVNTYGQPNKNTCTRIYYEDL